MRAKLYEFKLESRATEATVPNLKVHFIAKAMQCVIHLCWSQIFLGFLRIEAT